MYGLLDIEFIPFKMMIMIHLNQLFPVDGFIFRYKNATKNNTMQGQRAQAATGVALSAFVLTHIANHALMHFGPEIHQQLFSKIRNLFRAAPIVEFTLFASLGLHAMLGLKNFSGFDFGTNYFIHQASGWYLLLGLPPHM